MKVPEGWRRLALSAAVEVNPSRPLPRGEVAPFIEMAAVSERSARVRYVQSRVFEGGGARFANGDVLLARITPCAENGKTALISGLGGVGFGSTEFIVLAPKDGTTTSKFIYQLLKSDRVRSLLVSRMVGTSGRQRIPNTALDEVIIGVPPVEEQEKIASILFSVDEAIEATEAVIDQLQVVKKAMMAELLTKGIPGWHSRFKKTEIGEVPEGWAVVDVLDVVERMRPAGAVQRSAYKTRGKYPVVDQGAEFIAGYTDDASLVVDTTGPTILFGDHTREWKYLDFPFVCGADGTQLLRAKSGINPRFLYFALSALPLKNLGYARHFKLLREAKIALPDCREQGEIANAVQAVVDRENAERAKVAGLRELKAALLSVLLTGEVRVRGGAPIPGPSPVAGEGRAEG